MEQLNLSPEDYQRFLKSKTTTSVNITQEIKLLIEKYPEWNLSKFIRETVDEEFILDCIEKGKHVFKKSKRKIK